MGELLLNIMCNGGKVWVGTIKESAESGMSSVCGCVCVCVGGWVGGCEWVGGLFS